MTRSGEQPVGDSQIPARHSMRWWDLAVAAVVLLVALLVSISLRGARDSHELIASGGGALGILLIFVLLYVFWGRAGLRRAMLQLPTRPAEAWFLLVTILLVGAGLTVNPYLATLQTLVYPMIWMYGYTYWASVRWSALLALAVGATGFFLGEFADFFPLAYAGLGFVFTVAMGTWITQIALRGERYRELSEQLRATQAEVAVFSEAAGASAERERLSRELHDTLTQTLTGLVMLSEQAERALAAGEERAARDRLGRVQAAAREALGEARALVATTQPLGDGGLESAIQRLADRMRADTDLRVTCALETVVLDRERQVMLLRATQEGLANARKHAQASEVAISLAVVGAKEGSEEASATSAGIGHDVGDDACQDVVVILRVDDNGIGVESERIATGGFGLTGLADRIRGVGGQVHVGPGALGGARLEVRLPLGAAGSRAEGGIS